MLDCHLQVGEYFFRVSLVGFSVTKFNSCRFNTFACAQNSLLIKMKLILGTELYRERLVRAIARDLQVPLLVLDSSVLAPYVRFECLEMVKSALYF